MGRMNDLMIRVQICQDFGWTYEQYESQPDFFLRAIKEKMRRDQKQQELEVKKYRGK
jgi:hypothetical protein